MEREGPCIYDLTDKPSTPVSQGVAERRTPSPKVSDLLKVAKQSPSSVQEILPSSQSSKSAQPSSRFTSYGAHYHAFYECVQASLTSPKTKELLNSLQTDWPYAPLLHAVLYGEPWGLSEPIIRLNTHPKNDFGEALANITNTGRMVSESEQQYLRVILTHWCGWSATDPGKMNEPCFKYIQYRNRHLGRLYPILDDIWWPEDVQDIPPNLDPGLPSRLLFANDEHYFVYTLEYDFLYRAGKTLEEVFIGLKEGRDVGIPEDGSWEYEEIPYYEEDYYSYFPGWIMQHSGICKPYTTGGVQPFVPEEE
jgi:hypothetical protein